MNTVQPSRLDGRKFLFDGAAQELGFIPVEGAGKSAAGSSHTAVDVTTAGIGQKQGFGDSDTAVDIEAIGAGAKQALGSSDTAVDIEAVGQGIKRAIGSSDTAVDIEASGVGQKQGFGDSDTAVGITAVGQGVKAASGSSSAAVGITTYGDGQAGKIGKSATGVIVETSGEGRKSGVGGSSTAVEIDAVGKGRGVLSYRDRAIGGPGKKIVPAEQDEIQQVADLAAIEAETIRAAQREYTIRLIIVFGILVIFWLLVWLIDNMNDERVWEAVILLMVVAMFALLAIIAGQGEEEALPQAA